MTFNELEVAFYSRLIFRPLKSGTVDRNCSTAPLAEGNNVKTGRNSVMESSLREGNIIVEPVDLNLNLSTAPLTEENSMKSGGNKVMESSIREGNNIESTGPIDEGSVLW